MTRRTRAIVFLVGFAGLATLVGVAVLALPAFGTTHHPYRTLAVLAALSHKTANVVTSITFDQRGIDTFGEECILLASVVSASLLLRPSDDESERHPLSTMPRLDATRFVGYALLPVSAVIGFDIVAHGTVTPGGGFQGGVVLGTSIHLLYVAGSYDALERLRPMRLYEWGEALGAGAYACLGAAGLLASASFLTNFLPQGSLGTLFSGGTAALLNGAVGIEVASGMSVLLAHFLRQAIFLRDGEQKRSSGRSSP
jgi:multicomponent Na+:H+ antiporter subunit B